MMVAKTNQVRLGLAFLFVVGALERSVLRRLATRAPSGRAACLAGRLR